MKTNPKKEQKKSSKEVKKTENEYIEKEGDYYLYCAKNHPKTKYTPLIPKLKS